jgi:hypothetical protein
MYINANVFKWKVTIFFWIFKIALRNFIMTKDLKFTIKYKKSILLGHNGAENSGLIQTALISLLLAKICGWKHKYCFVTQIGKLRGQFWCEINLINHSDYTTIEIGGI